jgi:hypothetical protein
MVDLSPSTSLAFRDAVAQVVERCQCSTHTAMEALRQAGREGAIRARGIVPLNASRDPHDAWRRSGEQGRQEDLEPSDWAAKIELGCDRVGRTFKVILERSSFEDWLGRGSHRTGGVPLPNEDRSARAVDGETSAQAPISRSGAKPTKRSAVIDYLDNHYPEGIPPDVPLKSIATATGVSERTVRRARGRK